MNTHILFTDLDGTLLNDRKELTAGNRAALELALSEGHKIIIATGRPLVSALIQAKRLGLTSEGCYALCYNGALIYDLFREEIVYSVPFPKHLIRPLFDLAHSYRVHIQTYSSTHIVSEKDNSSLRTYAKHNLLECQIVSDVTTALDRPAHKLIAIGDVNPDALKEYESHVRKIYSAEIDCFYSNAIYMEHVAKGVNKGTAVEWLCNYLGIPLENSVAAGDAENDITMLEKAHIGAVMCNAYPGIAAHGNYITKADNNHDGVAEIIHQFILK